MKELKCTSCGGQLHQIETEKNTYVCLHCGNRQVLEDNITNNNYNVTNNVVNHIYGNVVVDDNSADSIKNVETYITLKEYKKAHGLLLKMLDDSPDSSEVWWLLAKVSLLSRIEYLSNGHMSHFNNLKHDDYYNKAILVATNEEKTSINKEYSELKSQLNSLIKKRKKSYTLRPLFLGLLITFLIVATLIIFAEYLQ